MKLRLFYKEIKIHEFHIDYKTVYLYVTGPKNYTIRLSFHYYGNKKFHPERILQRRNKAFSEGVLNLGEDRDGDSSSTLLVEVPISKDFETKINKEILDYINNYDW